MEVESRTMPRKCVICFGHRTLFLPREREPEAAGCSQRNLVELLAQNP